jgi:hypothetical protein
LAHTPVYPLRIRATGVRENPSRINADEYWERTEFGAFIVDQFGLAMKRLGFIYNGPGEDVPVYLPVKNVKLYHLAFYSKNELGMKFWRTARKGSDDQLGLFE